MIYKHTHSGASIHINKYTTQIKIRKKQIEMSHFPQANLSITSSDFTYIYNIVCKIFK